MTTYRYKGVSPDGVRVTGVIHAYNEYEAATQLRSTCAIITKIEPVPETREKNPVLGGYKIKEKELAVICSQFSIILTSGLPIVRCVEMVAAQTRTKELRRGLTKVAQDVSGGYSLAQSFENNVRGLPVTFLETVRAGEQSGTLELCFERLHTYYDKSAKTKAKLVSALTYPALVLVVAAIVFLVIMTVAVPMFTKTFEELGTELPGITKGLIAFSNFFTNYWWVLALIVLGLWIGKMILRRTPQGRLFLAEGKLRRSPLRGLYQMRASAQFASTMSTMLTAGLPIVKALDVTAGVISNAAVSEAVRRVKSGVEQGRGVAACMEKERVFPQMLTEMTGVGERAGSMEQTLNVIAEYFDNEVSVKTQRLLSLLEPAITIALAVITVILLLAVYLPMFTMYGSIA